MVVIRFVISLKGSGAGLGSIVRSIGFVIVSGAAAAASMFWPPQLLLLLGNQPVTVTA